MTYKFVVALADREAGAFVAADFSERLAEIAKRCIIEEENEPSRKVDFIDRAWGKMRDYRVFLDEQMATRAKAIGYRLRLEPAVWLENEIARKAGVG